MSPRVIPLIPTENFSASPSSLHFPGDRVIGKNAPTPTGSATPPSLSSTATGHRMRRPLAPHSGGIHVPRSRPISRVSFHRVPISAFPAAPVKPRRLVTALPRLRDARTLYTTPPMTLHWNAARAHFSFGTSFHHSFSFLAGPNPPGSEYITPESSEPSSDAPSDRGIPRRDAEAPSTDGAFARRRSRLDNGTASSEMARSRSRASK